MYFFYLDLNGITSFFGTVFVKKDPLELVADGNIYRVNNKEGKNKTPNPPEIIVQNALKQVGQIKEYKLTSDNCEHFATRLRYGDGFSDQVFFGQSFLIGTCMGSSNYIISPA